MVPVGVMETENFMFGVLEGRPDKLALVEKTLATRIVATAAGVPAAVVAVAAPFPTSPHFRIAKAQYRGDDSAMEMPVMATPFETFLANRNLCDT
jgi:hypothetical protein